MVTKDRISDIAKITTKIGLGDKADGKKVKPKGSTTYGMKRVEHIKTLLNHIYQSYKLKEFDMEEVLKWGVINNLNQPFIYQVVRTGVIQKASGEGKSRMYNLVEYDISNKNSTVTKVDMLIKQAEKVKRDNKKSIDSIHETIEKLKNEVARLQAELAVASESSADQQAEPLTIQKCLEFLKLHNALPVIDNSAISSGLVTGDQAAIDRCVEFLKKHDYKVYRPQPIVEYVQL